MRLIDADTLSEHKFVSINCYLKSNCDNGFSQYKQGWNDAIDAIIDNAPTVERPRGEWGKWIISVIQCPDCLECFNFPMRVYSMEVLKECPNCGADMRGGRE